MKKILSFILIFSLILGTTSLAGCNTRGITFPAVIRYTDGDHFIVEGLPENDINHTWAFQFSLDENISIIENGEKISATDLAVGDVIEITYAGFVLEIAPAIIQGILKIERVSDHDKTDEFYDATVVANVIGKTDSAILISDIEGFYFTLTGTYELPIDEVKNAFAIGAGDRIRISYMGEITPAKGDKNGSFEKISDVEILEVASEGIVFTVSNGYLHLGHAILSFPEDTPIYHDGKRISIADIHLGDRVRFWYDGSILETYPASYTGITRIELLEAQITPQTGDFLAYIEEIDGMKITVRGDTENEDEYFHGRFTFTLTEDTPLHDAFYPKKLEFPLGVGDRIRIAWSGTIADLTPAIIDNVIFIQRLHAENPPSLGLHLVAGIITEIGEDTMTLRKDTHPPVEEYYEIPLMDETKYLTDGTAEIQKSDLAVGDRVLVRYKAPVCNDPLSYLVATENVEKLPEVYVD